MATIVSYLNFYATQTQSNIDNTAITTRTTYQLMVVIKLTENYNIPTSNWWWTWLIVVELRATGIATFCVCECVEQCNETRRKTKCSSCGRYVRRCSYFFFTLTTSSVTSVIVEATINTTIAAATSTKCRLPS